MMDPKTILLGIDVGATSIKAGAFSPEGQLLVLESAPNSPTPQPGGAPEWRIWDLEAIWSKVCGCTRRLRENLSGAVEVKGVAVSGFGTDGVPMALDGRQLYPCISWHCARTVPQARQSNAILGAQRIYEITGYHNYPINTLNRLLWLKENAPGVLENTAYWLHVQDYIVFRLTGEFSTESTIASTTMCLHLKKRAWAEDLLSQVGLTSRIFSPLYESGSRVGSVTSTAAEESGIPKGAPVATGGHDTELAILGAGIQRKETFLDINGTWEILMAITDFCDPSEFGLTHGLDWECHAVPGWWNCQALMLAGGAIEWIRHQFYRDSPDYATLMDEASRAPLAANHVVLLPAFVRGMGPAQAHDPLGALIGLTTQTTREDIARATFEGLSYQFYQQIHAIEQSLNVQADSIRVTGGGQKNPFWMQMKADMSGRALDIVQNVESALLGAAILAGIGGGVYRDAFDALDAIPIPVETIEPDLAAHNRYQEHYEKVISKIPESMEKTFRLIHDFA
ncbi:MAG: FGGY-family carbohydrate kinase [Candidatus Omnitrophica bacterium]|nr:FGGY-family carbohydrate kinase [Candidatus Omnitrophota bacterium]